MSSTDVLFVEVHIFATYPNASSPGIDALRAARSQGHRTVVLSSHAERYPRVVHDLVDEWRTCDTRDGRAMVDAAVGTNPVALLTFSDLYVGRETSRAAHALGLRAATPDSPALARDKSAVRAAFDAVGLPNPRWARLDPSTDPLTSAIGYPCIFKPIDGAASWDVKRVDDDAELRAAIEMHSTRALYGGRVAPKHIVLLEEEMVGDVFSVEGFVDGEDVEIWGYTDREIVGDPFFVEKSLTYGAESPIANVDDYVRTVIRATGYDFGAFHLELLATADGPRVVELNARLIGMRVHVGVRLTSGVDSADYVLRRFLGERPTSKPSPLRASTARSIFVSVEGVLTGVGGAARAAALPGVHEVLLWGEAGDDVRPPTSNTDAIGQIVTVADTAEESCALAVAAEDALEITVASAEAQQ